MMAELIFRVLFLVVLAPVFSISAYHRKRARESGDVIARREEGVIVLVLRMGLALPFLASLLLYVLYPRALVWSRFSLPLWSRSLAAAVALLTIPATWWVFRSIGRNISETVLTKSDHRLVTQGPYRWVRHPLYTVSLLMLFSLGVVAANWFILAYCTIGLGVFRFLVIPAEEKQLLVSFGDEYREYQRRTGALVPRLFK